MNLAGFQTLRLCLRGKVHCVDRNEVSHAGNRTSTVYPQYNNFFCQIKKEKDKLNMQHCSNKHFFTVNFLAHFDFPHSFGSRFSFTNSVYQFVTSDQRLI